MKLLLLDIDGLRADVFSTAFDNDRIPNLRKVLSGNQESNILKIPALAPAPSITFRSQASLFTGYHPSQHCVPGNQFFDRFGVHSEDQPRFYAFDVGDTLEVDDAVQVFTDELASKCLTVPTIYERFSDLGWTSVVVGNMYAKGADHWVKPSLTTMARFTKGGDLFGMSSNDFDAHIIKIAIDHLQENRLPDVLTLYLMGLDHISHEFGPNAQLDYLTNVVDPLIGTLWDAVCSIGTTQEMVVSLFSDHGQGEAIPDDKHSLKLAFPFDKELAHFFDSLGLDVHNYPGEDPNCDAVLALNGGLAHVYIQNQEGLWKDQPNFSVDILPVAQAFWGAHRFGEYARELDGALSGVLIRNVQESGWYAPYLAFTPDYQTISLEEWFSAVLDERTGFSTQPYSDPVNRLNNIISPFVGDILLVSNYSDGFYFGSPKKGIHGGLHPEESQATMVFGFPGYGVEVIEEMQEAVLNSINHRCLLEGNRQPSTADLLTGLLAVLPA
jgi:hypothetical protein